MHNMHDMHNMHSMHNMQNMHNVHNMHKMQDVHWLRNETTHFIYARKNFATQYCELCSIYVVKQIK